MSKQEMDDVWKNVRIRGSILDEIETTIKARPEYPSVASFVETASKRFLDECKGDSKK